MSDIEQNKTIDVKQWASETLKRGVYEIVEQDVLDASLVEAKPAWTLPQTLLIGKIRNKGSVASTRWFICGDCQTSHLPEEMAINPRVAARHFAMSWQAQLGPEIEQLTSDQEQILRQAESLYELTLVDEIWQGTAG